MVISCRFPTHAILSVDAPWVVGSQLGYSVSLVCAVKHTERTLHKRIVYSPAHAHVNIQVSYDEDSQQCRVFVVRIEFSHTRSRVVRSAER